jgi:ankyrin repeat protein
VALLNHGANIEMRNPTGMTPVMRAVEFGHNDTVKVLLARGANINATATESLLKGMRLIATNISYS